MIETVALIGMIGVSVLSVIAMRVLNDSWQKKYDELTKEHSQERREWYENRQELLERINNQTLSR